MAILVSPVGLQPAAVATVARTLQVRKSLGHVHFLYTPKTQRESQRLVQWCEGVSLSATQHVVSEQLVAESGPPTMTDEMVRIIGSAQGEPCYVNISPGLNYLIADTGRELACRSAEGRTLDCIPVYAEFSDVCLVTSGEALRTENIGLAETLTLHDLSLDVGGGRHRLRYGAVSIPVEYVREDAGRVTCIVKLGDGGLTENEVRELHRNGLNRLRPGFFVMSRDRNSTYRLAMNGIAVLPDDGSPLSRKCQERTIDRIKSGNIPPPGSARPPTTRQDVPINPIRGGGGERDVTLVVCLGNDPSATLVALFAHRPAKAMVCYDARTPYVAALAGRLAAHAARLPVGELRFFATDILGTGLPQDVRNIIDRNTTVVEANVSPGSKAQAWRLSQCLDWNVYSINRKGQAEPFEAGLPALPFHRIPPILSALLSGGNLREGDVASMKGILGNEIVLRRLLHMVSTFGARRRSFSLRNLATIFKELHHTFDNASNRIKISVEDSGKKCEADFKAENETDGFWLEDVVAYALFKALGDSPMELVKGITWTRTTPDGRELSTNELDLAVTWGNDLLLAVSVKQGYGHGDPVEERQKAITEIAAVARNNLGRFCIPVLIGPRVALCPPAPESVLELHYHELGNPAELAAKIDLFSQSVRTTKKV